jgi:hypothetical protein
MRGFFVSAALAVACLGAACGGDDAGNGECNPNAEPCLYTRDVSTLTVGGGVEDEDKCQSWTLNNATELWVNAVSESNNGAYHHANWFFVPDNLYPFPDGVWSCNDAGFVELNAAVAGGYLFALSTQSELETQALPEGSAIRIPPYSRIIGSSHLLNASPDEVTTTMHLEISTIPPSQVRAKMAPARIQYHDLTLDAQARSSFTTECLFADDSVTQLGHPLQYELHYVLTHYHGLGSYTQLEYAGGPHDGEVITRHEGFGENFGVALDPPVDLAAAGADGVRFTCGFTNPRNATVGWGIGDQEMCVVALQAKTDLAWDGDVRRGTNEPATTVDGEIQYGGPCEVLAFPWDFNKGGGPPR